TSTRRITVETEIAPRARKISCQRRSRGEELRQDQRRNAASPIGSRAALARACTRDVACYAPSLIHGQHLGNVSIGFFITPIHVSERLAVSILHFVATWNLINGPWWGKACQAPTPYRLSQGHSPR